MAGLPKFWLVCLIFTDWAGSSTQKIGRRRRGTWIFLARGGMPIMMPEVCSAGRTFARESFGVFLATICDRYFLATEKMMQLMCHKKITSPMTDGAKQRLFMGNKNGNGTCFEGEPIMGDWMRNGLHLGVDGQRGISYLCRGREV